MSFAPLRHAWFTGLLALLWLGGCASSQPPAQRYVLPSAQMVTPAPPPQATRQLRVAPPRLARSIDGTGIVVQLDPLRLQEARGHLWAEPLAEQLARALRARLARRLPDTRLLPADAPRDDAALSLQLEVERFQGHHAGHALVAGQWRLSAPDGRLLLADAFNATTPLARDGYPALVQALDSSWDQVIEAIATALRAAPR